MIIVLLIFMSDIIYFIRCIVRNVLVLLSTILYDLWFEYNEYLMRESEKGLL